MMDKENNAERLIFDCSKHCSQFEFATRGPMAFFLTMYDEIISKMKERGVVLVRDGEWKITLSYKMPENVSDEERHDEST